jgi:mono/diheme cytochrome c family protein
MKAKLKFFGVAASTAILTASLLAQDFFPARAQDNVPATERKAKWGYYALTHGPVKAREKTNPLALDPTAARAGGKLFEQHCAECHGRKAEGGRRGPSLRAKEVQEAAPGAIFWILSNGVIRRGMPDWSKLPELQRWQIITFMDTFKSSGKSAAKIASPERDRSRD